MDDDVVVVYVFFVRPQSPTTTPLCRRVAKNPHIAYRHHVRFAVTRDSDEGRAVGTFFVGSATIPSPTGSVWWLRIDVLGTKVPAPLSNPLAFHFPHLHPAQAAWP